MALLRIWQKEPGEGRSSIFRERYYRLWPHTHTHTRILLRSPVSVSVVLYFWLVKATDEGDERDLSHILDAGLGRSAILNCLGMSDTQHRYHLLVKAINCQQRFLLHTSLIFQVILISVSMRDAVNNVRLFKVWKMLLKRGDVWASVN